MSESVTASHPLQHFRQNRQPFSCKFRGSLKMDVIENLKFCQSKQPNYLILPKPAVIGFKTKLQLFYFVFNNYLCIRGILELRSELFGKAFENWAYHELQTFNTGAEAFADISYWRLASGIESVSPAQYQERLRDPPS